MKKDIEWLKEKVKGEYEYNRAKHNKEGFEGYAHREFVFKYVLGLLDQLDEPEVLTQELPVIPIYVAKYLEFFKSYVPLKRVMEMASTRDEWHKWKHEYDWISANDESFARAWLDGFTIASEEEEPVYYALIKGHELIDSYDIYWNCDKSDYGVFVSRLHPPHDNFLTEMSKAEWNKLGINDANADFIKVDEELN